ncbi:unnamed protein product [Brassica oleracea]|uniref:(rape) hypothetical protein n=1 Tax=Brassica napus TaxID=3708 RepID=A0A816RH25_BRANA|nr:unnamed protein product [Brassica napus]
MSLLDFSTTRSFPFEVDSTVDNDQGTLSLVKASGGGTKIRKTGGGGGGGGGKTDVRYKYRQSVQAPRGVRESPLRYNEIFKQPSFSSFGRRYMPLFPLRPGVSDQFIGGKA